MESVHIRRRFKKDDNKTRISTQRPQKSHSTQCLPSRHKFSYHPWLFNCNVLLSITGNGISNCRENQNIQSNRFGDNYLQDFQTQSTHKTIHTHKYVRNIYNILACFTLSLIIAHSISDLIRYYYIIWVTHTTLMMSRLFRDKLIDYLEQNGENGDANGNICCYTRIMRYNMLGLTK